MERKMSDNIIHTLNTYKKRLGGDPSKGLYFVDNIDNRGVNVWYVEFINSSKEEDFKQEFVGSYTPSQFFKDFVHNGYRQVGGAYSPVSSEDVKKFLTNYFNSNLCLKPILDLVIEKWKDFDENVTNKEIMVTLQIIRRRLKAERQAVKLKRIEKRVEKLNDTEQKNKIQINT
jgi:hypothetical protein